MRQRILFVGGTTGGGVATINNEVIRVFREAGYDCGLVDTERLKARFPAALAYVLGYVLLAARVAARRPRLVYLQLAQTGYLHQSVFLLVAKLLGRETVAHFHAKGDLKATCTAGQLRAILASQRWTDHLVVITEASRRSLAANGWRGDIHVVPNFIATDELPETLLPVRERRRLLYLGRMDWEKGIHEILAVARRLPDEDFLFVGAFADDRQRKRFEAELAEVPNARWTGPAHGRDKYRILAESRFLLFPTKRDEFPMTLIEATSVGCIPLVANVGSVAEIVRDGENGVFIPAEDIDAIVTCIRAMQGRDDLQEMADRGVATTRARFTSDAVRSHLLGIAGAAP